MYKKADSTSNTKIVSLLYVVKNIPELRTAVYFHTTAAYLKRLYSMKALIVQGIFFNLSIGA
jgi:hypothetical protein